MILINECNKVNKKNDFIVILLLDYNIISHITKKIDFIQHVCN
jgi:hypothetical protein